jgi:hypothetical protein
LALVEIGGINGKQPRGGLMADSRCKNWNEVAQAMETWYQRYRYPDMVMTGDPSAEVSQEHTTTDAAT